MTWTPPEPYAYSCESKSQGIGYVETLRFKPIDAVREKLYTLDKLQAVRCEALQQALNLLHDPKEYTRQDCIFALENLIKELL